MRRVLPLALILVACAKPAVETPTTMVSKPMAAAPQDLTPEAMAKAMDVPLYPGAEAPDAMSMAPAKRSDGSTHYSLVLATKDSPAKVAAWYGAKLGMSSMGNMIAGKSKGGNDVLITVASEAGRTLIRIKSIAYAK